MENKLKCTDLRIGNYVNYENRPFEVIEISPISLVVRKKIGDIFEMQHRALDVAQPIELTEELLVKIGFEDRKGYFNYSRVFGDDGDYCDSIYIYYCPRLKHFKFTHNIVENLDMQTMDLYNIKYLHQLQNAYYCLTNQELEIEL